MKRAELEIGKVYAYSRYANPTKPYQIGGFIIDSLEPVLKYGNRGSTLPEVRGRYTDKYGNPTEGDKPTTMALRRIIGDYLTIKHDLELTEKNREIAQLKKSIRTKEVTELIEKNHQLYKRNTSDSYDSEHKTGISFYRLNNRYDGTVNIELNLDQFKNLTHRLNRLELLEARQAQEQETANA